MNKCLKTGIELINSPTALCRGNLFQRSADALQKERWPLYKVDTQVEIVKITVNCDKVCFPV